MKRTSQIKVQEIKKAVKDFRENKNKELHAFMDKHVNWIITFNMDDWEKKFYKLYGEDAKLEDYVNFGHGGVIKKDKVDEFNALLEKTVSAEKDFILERKENAFNLFFYEMNNHEYIYSSNDEVVLHACSIDEQFLKDNDLQETYNKARRYYWNLARQFA